MSEFFELVKLKTEIPPLYGTFHICCLIIAVLVCTVGIWQASKLSKKAGDRLIFFCGIILLVAEIYKQLFYFYNVGKGSYVWRIFPFQLCSVPMYICLIVTFLKNGKLQQTLYDFLFVFSTLGGVAVLLVPSSVMTSFATINIHSFLWHIILVFVGLFVGVTGRAGLEYKNYFNSLKIFGVCAVIAFAINCIFSEVSNNEITMFFIGPNTPKAVILEDFTLNYGWFPATILYLLALCLGGFLVFIAFNIYSKRKPKLSLTYIQKEETV